MYILPPYVKVSLYIAWRVLQAMVVIPASVVGMLVFVFAIAGASPLKNTLEFFYVAAEQTIRPAPPGNILVEECVDKATLVLDGKAKPLTTCKETTSKLIPISEAVDSATGTISSLYFTLAAISLGCLFIFVPGRRFIGLDTQTK